MKIYAALDLRGGAAVQLVGGDPGDERIRLPDPADIARRWLALGFRYLHVVDLDAALGDGDNAEAIEAIATARGRATLQVGGGVRDQAAIERALRQGADRVVVGTRAVEDPEWVKAAAARFPDRIVVAADTRDGQILTRGWTASTGLDALEFVALLDALPLAAVLVTDVGREGRQEGIDRAAFRSMAGATRHPLIAAGGITEPDDLGALVDAGAAGAVLGMALYSGRLDPADALHFQETE